MPIDVTRDKLITLEEVSRMFPDGKGGHVHLRSVYRWVDFGCWGIKLEAEPVGGKIYTTAAALREFSRKLKELRGGEGETVAEVERQVVSESDADARQALADAGFSV